MLLLLLLLIFIGGVGFYLYLRSRKNETLMAKYKALAESDGVDSVERNVLLYLVPIVLQFEIEIKGAKEASGSKSDNSKDDSDQDISKDSWLIKCG